MASPLRSPASSIEQEQVLLSDLQQLKKVGVFFLLFIGLVCAGFGLIYLDIAIANTQLLEVSFTEIGQELMLAACAGLFWTSRGTQAQEGFNALAGGFFACLLVRELDGLFDPISHSFWLWPALGTAAVCIVKAVGKYHKRIQTLSALAQFTRQSSFTMIVAGLGVLVFSRIFGMGTLWHHILQEGYQRLAKTTAEEGVELLAYCLFLTGSLQYYVRQLKSGNT
jgi:hypothetical protein